VVLVTAGYDANYYYTSEITAELKMQPGDG